MLFRQVELTDKRNLYFSKNGIAYDVSVTFGMVLTGANYAKRRNYRKNRNKGQRHE
jgi:hypothetical protein